MNWKTLRGSVDIEDDFDDLQNDDDDNDDGSEKSSVLVDCHREWERENACSRDICSAASEGLTRLL